MTNSRLIQKCIAIDLEVGRDTGRIHRFGAIRGDNLERTLVFAGGSLEEAFIKLDTLAMGAEFVLGHNAIAFDLPKLQTSAPKLHILSLPVIDTLYLSPLAFPQNPYHRLVKHYKDGGLLRFRQNDPELDARICLQLLAEEEEAFSVLNETNPQLLSAWHWLLSKNQKDRGVACLFETVRGMSYPSATEGAEAVRHCLDDAGCNTAIQRLLETISSDGWPLTFCLAWLSVAGSNSVMPPWVRHEFPEAAQLVRQLRDIRCEDSSCRWCETHHNPKRMLKRWFGLSEFRTLPACADGRSMQEEIVEASMRQEHVLGILPTGTGKSVCYQVPALSRYENTGALTIAISPLVALMEDQVNGLQARGISSCVALNSLLSMPERADALERVRLGDIAILLVSPEQLRNRAFRKVVQQREIGAWVLDEAHCLSKWGHDFRTDYRYVGRFIKESSGEGPTPPVMCLTATAKPDVVTDICDYFLQTMGVELRVFNGGANRSNLDYVVVETTSALKMQGIHRILESQFLSGQAGGAIVYCSTRGQTENVAKFLMAMGWAAAHFHAGLSPEMKKTTQQRFISGELRIIVATNAFGMGIDKPDVRLVLHADIPGSLENYVQEAGRAGRDQQAARCVLLYCEQDIEQQFGLSAYSRIPHHEIQAVLRALRRLAGKRRPLDEAVEVVATPGEILSENMENDFFRDRNTEDTRVRTAIACLEKARLVLREENHYQVFPSTLRTNTLEETDARLAYISMPYRGQLRSIVELLMSSDPTEGVTTDELMGVSRLSSSGVSRAMHDLERCGVITNDSIFTALVHIGVENASIKRMENATAMETALIGALQEVAPDMEKGDSSALHLRRLSQHLKDAGYVQALPELIYRLLQGMESDGRSDNQGMGSIRLRKIDAESVLMTLQRDWEKLRDTAELRRTASKLLLEHLLSRVPTDVKGNDLLAKTTIGNLNAAVESDLALNVQIKDPCKLVECSLLWLHEQEIVRLGKGLVVLRPAMNIRVAPGNSPFTRSDYAELQDHYNEQVVQIHVMAEYARQGLKSACDAMILVGDYFTQSREAFIQRWFPNALKSLLRQTGDESWQSIVETLNPVQRHIVTDEREHTNALVLAGPGSGKTRVLVHRIAFLVRVRRENPNGILALAYNRHAVVEIRKRLCGLIGDDSRGVTVLTCHALAMRLTGTSFAERCTQDVDFKKVLLDAIQLLKQGGLLADDPDDQRERLLAGFRWILVDEYQDIGPEQYELISALAGRTLNDPERCLSLFAVGDDDQNVYGFAGASVEYIRRFQGDYKAKPEYLTDNYRSTVNIINVSNALIAQARSRMKAGRPIEIDAVRRNPLKPDPWEKVDQVGKGRVQILTVDRSFAGQAAMVMEEMLRLAGLDPEWDWSKTAVIARQWHILHAVRAFCEMKGIPSQRADQESTQFWRLRETQNLLNWLSERKSSPIKHEEMEGWLAAQPQSPWNALLVEAAANYRLECGDGPLPGAHLREWLAEWGREIRQRQNGILLLTAHRVKGLEFDHVAVLDGAWEEHDVDEDPDVARRLFYVAMTRARKTLTIARMKGRNRLVDSLPDISSLYRRDAPAIVDLPPELNRHYDILTPGDIDLGYVGRYFPGRPIHRVVSSLRYGDPLQLVLKDNRWLLYSRNCPVGRLARNFETRKGMQCVEARVHSIIVRFREDGDQAYANSMQCDRWEVVLPELIFTPCDTVHEGAQRR